MIMTTPPVGERIVLHILDPDDPRRRAYNAALLAWARINGLPATQTGLSREKPITVHPGTGQVSYWIPAGTYDTNPGYPICATTHLTIRPAGILIGASTCGFMTRLDGDPTIYVCTQPVDGTARHRGDHHDTARGDTRWPNIHTSGPALPDTTGRTPAGQHAQVIAALQEALTKPGADITALRGRHAILQRHRPGLARLSPRNLYWCADHHHQDADLSFPCPDYRDAAAGLVTGLEAT